MEKDTQEKNVRTHWAEKGQFLAWAYIWFKEIECRIYFNAFHQVPTL